MPVAAPERLRQDLARLVHRGADVRSFSLRAAEILTRQVPFDGVCLVTLDPVTLLPTGEVADNALPAGVRARMVEIELGGRDVNAFTTLARSNRPVRSLGEATDGDLDRSQRHRELRGPNGFGDELRAALVDGSSTWGGLTLLRCRGTARFTPAEEAVVESLLPLLAEGLRRAVLLSLLPHCTRSALQRHAVSDCSLASPAAAAPSAAGLERAGVALLAADNSVVTMDAAAEMWLSELRDTPRGDPLPPVASAVAGRARAVTAGYAAEGAVAWARARTPAGKWLVLRGSTLGDGPDAPTALIVEPARPHELAPLVAEAYGLTERERAVTQLVARGCSTTEIGVGLHLSPWTVQDHLKAIFEKVGVSTRGELVAHIFLAYYAPRPAAACPG
jgi:DNA-binding CsgD family transcriptional regulator